MTHAADSTVIIYHIHPDAMRVFLVVFIAIPSCLYWLYGFFRARRFKLPITISLTIGFTVAVLLFIGASLLHRGFDGPLTRYWLVCFLIAVAELLAVPLFQMLPSASRTGQAKVGMVALLFVCLFAATAFYYGLDFEKIRNLIRD
jgi:hypothetical protein